MLWDSVCLIPYTYPIPSNTCPASTASAITTSCPSSNVCYALSIPDATASAGNGDIYFQLSGPTSYEYIALGQGSSMSGANIFVMYTSADVNNVTISPRLGTGHVQPEHDTSTNLELLEGSGVSGGVMTANVRCGNCHSWDGGSMDFSSSSAMWIYAVKSGSPLDTDALDADISIHDSASSFTFDLSAARGGTADANPFGSSSNNTGTSGLGIPATCTPITTSTRTQNPTSCPTQWPPASGYPTARPTWAASCFENGPPNGWHGHGPPSWDGGKLKTKQKRDDNCPAGYEASNLSTSSSSGGGGTSYNTLILAHGILASLAFVALFPLGGILIRIFSFPNLLRLHASLQILATLIYLAAFAMGMYLATQWRILTSAHPILGIAAFVVVLHQPVTGLLHHKLWKKYQDRTLWSYVHLWGGRVGIVLGMVNGGLGLALAGAGRGAVIAYAVVAGVVGVLYVGVVVLAGRKRRGREVGEAKDVHRQGRYRGSLSGGEEYGRRRQRMSRDVPPEYYSKRGRV